MKEQDKIRARELNEMEITNMPDREFKVMAIKIHSGLEKREEDLSELLNKEIENIKKEQGLRTQKQKLKIHCSEYTVD